MANRSSKIKIIRVTCCDGCPYYDHCDNRVNQSGIPDNCPLHDEEEEGEKT